jgi:hypothetical protein
MILIISHKHPLILHQFSLPHIALVQCSLLVLMFVMDYLSLVAIFSCLPLFIFLYRTSLERSTIHIPVHSLLLYPRIPLPLLVY